MFKLGPTIELTQRRDDLTNEEVSRSWPKVTYTGRDIIELLCAASDGCL